MILAAVIGAMTLVGRVAEGDELFPPRLARPIEVDGRTLAVPTAQQAAWQDLEVGMFIHLAPQTWQDRETDDLSTPVSVMNPEELDTDQWVRVAESMGAKYIVFVAKHEGRLLLVADGDDGLWREEHALARREGRCAQGSERFVQGQGIKLGVYLSPQDRKHGVGIGGRAKDVTKQAEYETLFRRQLTEVLSNYGEMVEVWFDGSLVFEVGDILERHAPNAVVFQGPQATIRWVGNEDGIAPEVCWNAVKMGVKSWGDYTAKESDPEGNRWLPNECDARIRATWFWRTDNQKTLKSVRLLMEMYEQSVGHGAVLLLNNTPDRSGLIPEADARRSAEFGAEVRRVYGPGSVLAKASGKGKEIVVRPDSAVTIDRIVLMEDITKGERIRVYETEGLIGGVWTSIGGGRAVGQKHIERLAPVKVEAVRIRVTESVGEPIFRQVSLHRMSMDAPAAKESKP